MGKVDTLLSARDVTLMRGGKRMLDRVSLEVCAGDFTTIVGPNGAGKSLLLRALLGLESVEEGVVVRTDGVKIGYMPERFVLDSSIPMRVGRFLRMGGVRPDAGIIDDTQIGGLLDSPMQGLSAGETQRVLLARALTGAPDILVLDEPAQNLDMNGQLAFYKLVSQLYRARGLTILMVSHDLHLVMSETKRVVCLFHHICCSGSPQSVARDPEFTRLFGAEMARFVSVYPHTHDHEHHGA